MPSLKDNLLNHQATQQLNATLRTIFRQQAIEVAGRVRIDGEVPELVNWVEATAEAAIPLLLRLAQRGILETQLRLAKRGVSPGITLGRASGDVRQHAVPVGQAFGVAKGVMYNRGFSQSSQHPVRLQAVQRSSKAYVTKAVAPTVRVAFDIFNPRVLDAVRAAAFTFCRETMETARTDLATSLVDLRKLLEAGLPRGESHRLLAKRVLEIFADPARAFRIAVTEGSRAIHTGNLLAAKESGVVRGKSLVASSDACDLCLDVAEKGTIPLDQPFYVEAKGGPYAVVMTPPIHVHCFCSMNEEIE